MEKREKVATEHYDTGRRAASMLVAVVVMIMVFRLVFPLGGISGGGLLIVAALAYAVGIAAALLVRPNAKDDLLLWLMLFGVTIAATFMHLRGAIALLGSEGGPAR